jgi:hypothetical protein
MSTWDPANKNPTVTLSLGNLRATRGSLGGTLVGARSTDSHASGKWYYEITSGTQYVQIGWVNASWDFFTDNSPDRRGYDSFDGTIHGTLWGTHSSAYGAPFAPGDKMMMAIDLDNGLAWWGKNGVWQVGDPNTGTGGQSLTPGLTLYAGVALQYTGAYCDANFGGSPFSYTVPSGFTAWDGATSGGGTLVSRDSTLEWAVRALVSQDEELQWAVRTLVFQTDEYQWAVRALVADDSDIEYRVIGFVESDSTLVWKVTEPPQPPINGFNAPITLARLIGIAPARLL